MAGLHPDSNELRINDSVLLNFTYNFVNHVKAQTNPNLIRRRTWILMKSKSGMLFHFKSI